MPFFKKKINAFLYFRLNMKSVAIFVMEAMKNIHPATHADRNKCVYGIKVIAHPRYVY